TYKRLRGRRSGSFGRQSKWCDIILTTAEPPIISTPIPTLSEWGLIALAGILGIIGYIVMRRRKLTA
ncbi:MAG: IPTL-CTERM sorting domain-containing protein, partial [Candidatus Dadabacteria bacterium]|nr:IPTL-CTERM sorting domain-containing protein [Candidatus Dadabacteria bacterium]